MSITESMRVRKFEVWVYPTSINTTSKPRKVAGPFLSRIDAEEAKWHEEQDEPSPDKYEYFSWRVEETVFPHII